MMIQDSIQVKVKLWVIQSTINKQIQTELALILECMEVSLLFQQHGGQR